MFGHFQAENAISVISSTLLAALAVGLLLIVFKNIFLINTKKNFPFFYLGHIFFSGQIVRYLPGRIFGIAYQINETYRNIPPLNIIRINLEFMVLVILFNSLYSASILTNHFSNFFIAGILFVCGIIGLFFYLQHNCIDQLANMLHKLLPKKFVSTDGTDHQRKVYDPIVIIKILATFVVYFTLYCLSWTLLADFFDQFTQYEMVLLCALYTISFFLNKYLIVLPVSWICKHAHSRWTGGEGSRFCHPGFKDLSRL